MKPGDLVRSSGAIFIYNTAKDVNSQIPTDTICDGTVGTVLSPPDGTWIRWMLCDGRVAWSNWRYMEVISEAR
jgi:hypothetical protein